MQTPGKLSMYNHIIMIIYIHAVRQSQGSSWRGVVLSDGLLAVMLKQSGSHRIISLPPSGGATLCFMSTCTYYSSILSIP